MQYYVKYITTCVYKCIAIYYVSHEICQEETLIYSMQVYTHYNQAESI